MTRQDHLILEIAKTYGDLSPENLHCDGERAPSVARRIGARLEKHLKRLFKEYGREVDEGQAYALERALKMRRPLDRCPVPGPDGNGRRCVRYAGHDRFGIKHLDYRNQGWGA